MEHVELSIGGKLYKVAQFTPQQIAFKFVQWAKSVLPNPLDEIAPKLSLFPVEIQKEMVREAMARARIPLTVESPEVRALMNTVEGATKIASLRFQAAQPELTDEQCLDLLFQAGKEHGPDALADILK